MSNTSNPGFTTSEQAAAMSAAAKASATYFRKGHVVSDADSGAVVYTGMATIRGKEGPQPSINAAKRWVRQQVGMGRPVSFNL